MSPVSAVDLKGSLIHFSARSNFPQIAETEGGGLALLVRTEIGLRRIELQQLLTQRRQGGIDYCIYTRRERCASRSAMAAFNSSACLPPSDIGVSVRNRFYNNYIPTPSGMWWFRREEVGLVANLSLLVFFTQQIANRAALRRSIESINKFLKTH